MLMNTGMLINKCKHFINIYFIAYLLIKKSLLDHEKSLLYQTVDRCFTNAISCAVGQHKHCLLAAMDSMVEVFNAGKPRNPVPLL